MARVTFESVSKVFDNGVTAVDRLSLSAEDGEFLVLVGPSGCGKTTALRMLAGLEDLSDGVIRIGDQVMNDVPTKRRDIAMVFQNYSLYPHMTVRRNMGFSLKLRKIPAAVAEQQVDRAADILGLMDLLDRLPRQLSGGQRQRVAMGRAIVREPRVFLMDEPLSNLDAKLRIQMRAEVSRLQRRLGVTTVYVTHDQTEAMTMSDRVAVMRKGVLEQVAAPQVLYDRPANLFVAGFIGAPPMNLVKARLDIRDGEGVLSFGSHTLALAPRYLEARPGLARMVGASLALGIRPEDITDASFRVGSRTLIKAPVELVESLGSDTLVHMRIDTPGVFTDDTKELQADLGDVVLIDSGASTVFIGRCDARTGIRQGQAAEFAVEIDRMHFFDLESGKAL